MLSTRTWRLLLLSFKNILFETDAATGWVAVGFGQDKLMGDDAVVIATASGATSHWNIGTTGTVHDSLLTDDIGVMNENVQVRVWDHYWSNFREHSFSKIMVTQNKMVGRGRDDLRLHGDPQGIQHR